MVIKLHNTGWATSPASQQSQGVFISIELVLVLVPKPKKWFLSLTNVVSITLPIKRSAINFIINQTSLLRKYLAGLQHWCPSFVNGSKIYFWPFFGNFIFANFCRKKLIFSINPLWNKLAQTPSPTTTLCDRDRCDQGYIYIWFTPILQIDSPACTFQILPIFIFFS